MIVRVCASLAVVLGLALAAHAAPTGPDAPRTGGVVSTFKVDYKRQGETRWYTRPLYKELSVARAEMDRLYNLGFDVRLTHAKTITKLHPHKDGPSPDPTGGTLSDGISVVSLARAFEVYKAVAGRGDIAFRYPTDGCYARAHLMGLQMVRMGLRPGKVWAFDDEAMANKGPSRLVALTTAHPKGFVSWRYHVAPVLKVRTKTGKVVTCVIDPSLHDSPVSLTTWRQRMIHPRVSFTPRLDVTAWGVAPKDGVGKRVRGSGYYPGPDPPGDLTRLAMAKMAEFKPHQGTNWEPGPRPVVRGNSSTVPANHLSAIPEKPFTNKHLLDLPATSSVVAR
jgi:hypothetical protein